MDIKHLSNRQLSRKVVPLIRARSIRGLSKINANIVDISQVFCQIFSLIIGIDLIVNMFDQLFETSIIL